ncbi:MAG: hypothetical protein AAF978_10025 [Cyanobacteria bacterium P01_E01_bin.48]
MATWILLLPIWLSATDTHAENRVAIGEKAKFSYEVVADDGAISLTVPRRWSTQTADRYVAQEGWDRVPAWIQDLHGKKDRILGIITVQFIQTDDSGVTNWFEINVLDVTSQFADADNAAKAIMQRDTKFPSPALLVSPKVYETRINGRTFFEFRICDQQAYTRNMFVNSDGKTYHVEMNSSFENSTNEDFVRIATRLKTKP